MQIISSNGSDFAFPEDQELDTDICMCTSY